MSKDYMRNLRESEEYIRSKIDEPPKTAIVLGSGLGKLADEVEKSKRISYKNIPHFPKSAVSGHKGELVFGLLDGVPVMIMNGRVHYYEGWSMQDVTYSTRIAALLKIKNLILTNAAGGINLNFKPGDLMIINDHLSFQCPSPLIGPNIDELGKRFIDMSKVYDPRYRKILEEIITEEMGYYREGVYAFMSGPQYETPAEIRALRSMGADAAGMSTVPEAIVARHGGIPKILGISCITNMAAGIQECELNHEEVKETADRAGETFRTVVKRLVRRIEDEQ